MLALRSRLASACIAIVLAAPGAALAMGTEEFGPQPVTRQPGWANGVVEAIGLPTRVYSCWVNGNESFHYKGKTEDLNEALKRFKEIKIDAHEVFLLPAPGKTRSFHGKEVEFTWELRVPSGIYLALAQREKKTLVFTRAPTIVIYCGSPGLELKKVQAPAGLRLLGVEEAIARGVAGLSNEDETVAGQAAYLLGMHAASIEKVEPLIEALARDSQYVRVCAAQALGRIGKRSAPALEKIRACMESASESYRPSFEEAIQAIEGPGATGEKPQDPSLQKAIRAWIEKQKP